MACSTWPKLRRKIDRLRRLIDAPALVSRTGFTVELRGRGCITIEPGDLDEVEDVKHDLENLYIWLWNAKDHLINMLIKTGTPKAIATRMVEGFVNENLALMIAADVANTAKHASLAGSRSGHYARIGKYATKAPVPMLRQKKKDLLRRIRQESEAYITVEDDKGNEIGDAAKIAWDAANAWERFASQHSLLE